jgi:hypothetical protein
MKWTVNIAFHDIVRDVETDLLSTWVSSEEIDLDLPTYGEDGRDRARSMVGEICKRGFWIDNAFIPGNQIIAVKLEEKAEPKSDPKGGKNATGQTDGITKADN